MKELTPKQDFLKEPAAAQYAELAVNPLFRRALDIALEQFILDQGYTAQLNDAAVAQLALQGARRYISILLNLASPDTEPKPTPQGVLQWHSKPPQPQRERKPKV